MAVLHKHRNAFLRWASVVMIIIILTACAPKTVEVTKEVVVTKEVPKEVIITQQVEVEKLVTPTPIAYKTGGTLVLGMPGDIKTLDPHVSQLWIWQNIRFQIFERLFDLDEAGNIQPWLGKEFTWADPKTLQVTLRDDVTFQNGE
jgi:ABC-type transport system substrate-binding protein